MGVSIMHNESVGHPGALRILSLPPAQLIKDPLAPMRSYQHNTKPGPQRRQSMFHERLSGLPGTIYSPKQSPMKKISLPAIPISSSPHIARKSSRNGERPSVIKAPRPVRASFVIPTSTEKESLEVREAYRRVSTGGSWSGDLIRLSSALDQLAQLCHGGQTQKSLPRVSSGGLARYQDPLANIDEDNDSGTFNDDSMKNYHDYQSLQPSNFVGEFYTSSQNGSRINMSADPNLPPPLPERDWGPVSFPAGETEQPASGPPSPMDSVGEERLRRLSSIKCRMSLLLKALRERLVSWKGIDGGSQGVSSASSSSPLFDRHRVATTPTPSPDHSNGTMMPRKVVVALYDYNAAQVGDLCLRKNEEYEVLDDSEEHWWKMRNNQGREGYAPSNYVREKGNLGLQQYDWFLGDSSRQRAEAILMREEKEGCFVVRNSTTNTGIYTLSVFSKMSRIQVKHYHIKTDPDGLFYLSNSIRCTTIPDLIYRHQHNPGGLCTRLRNPPAHGRTVPTTAGLCHDKWEIVPSELNLLEELGSGQFGLVKHAKLYGRDVAVKMMKEGTMSEDEFIEEAKVMTKLQHPNLVQLYGVCRRKRPIYIVTEYLKHGSLLNYLRSKEKLLNTKTDVLLDMCLQVCEGMAYLESQKFIHRDLAARNCLVGSNNVIKVGDFGLARYVVDDEYTGSGGAKFPIKWAAPEVLNYMRFSSKTDVWAFGVLIWEVFTCGKMPYGRHKNAEVVEFVQQGKVLERSRHCPQEVYEIMLKCWVHSQEQRPGFDEVKVEITKVLKMIQD